MTPWTIITYLLLAGSPGTGNSIDGDNTTLATENWTQWRGNDRDGKAGDVAWPASLGPDVLKRQWHVPLGESYSGPIVTQDRVFVTETVDKKKEIVRALSRKDGSELWQITWEGSMSVPFFAARNGSWIRSTPAYSDGMLYVAGMEDVLVAINADTGEIAWKRDFPAEWGTKHQTFGMVCSPMIDGNDLYIQMAGAFLKLDKKTGKDIWKSLEDGNGMMGGAFSSPVMATLNGKEYLAVQTREELAGVSKEDGKVLWRQPIPSYRGMNILTPLVHQEQVFTSNYRGKSWMFDVSGDKPNLLWENKAAAYMSSPIIIDGVAYMHLQNKRVSALDLSNGEEKWRSGESFGAYWSMVHQGNKIMALDSDGVLLLINANPEKLDIIDKREVSESSTWAHLAVADNQAFVRELKGLTVFQWD